MSNLRDHLERSDATGTSPDQLGTSLIASLIVPPRISSRTTSEMTLLLRQDWREREGITHEQVCASCVQAKCCSWQTLDEISCKICEYGKPIKVTATHRAPTPLPNNSPVSEYKFEIRGMCTSSRVHMNAASVWLIVDLCTLIVSSTPFQIQSRISRKKPTEFLPKNIPIPIPIPTPNCDQIDALIVSPQISEALSLVQNNHTSPLFSQWRTTPISNNHTSSSSSNNNHNNNNKLTKHSPQQNQNQKYPQQHHQHSPFRLPAQQGSVTYTTITAGISVVVRLVWFSAEYTPQMSMSNLRHYFNTVQVPGRLFFKVSELQQPNCTTVSRTDESPKRYLALISTYSHTSYADQGTASVLEYMRNGKYNNLLNQNLEAAGMVSCVGIVSSW
ncbi:hypothetical protein Pelo_8683 [Pelomyxa schiedti]|nr:hypothetical protein Pelo_8683 [Pelomyxa schiedti]